MSSYLNAISFEFFTGNFKAANKKRVSKCSHFKCLHLGHKTFVKRKYFYCYFYIFVFKVINFANLYYKISLPPSKIMEEMSSLPFSLPLYIFFVNPPASPPLFKQGDKKKIPPSRETTLSWPLPL